MFCRMCGAELPEGAGFCGNCGAPVAKPVDVPAGGPAPVYGEDQPTMVRPPADAADQATVVRPPAETGDQPTVVRPPGTTLPPAITSPSAVAPPAPAGPAYGTPAPTPYQAGPAPSPSHAQGPAGPYGPYGPGGAGGYAPQPAPYGPPPRKKSRLNLWLALAATAVIVIAAALIAVWLLVWHEDETTTTTSTIAQVSTSTTTAPPTSTTSSAGSTTTSTAASTTTMTLPAGAPGDSSGKWVEVEILGLPANGYAVAVSEEALLIDTQIDEETYKLYAYMLDSRQLIELPVDGPDFFGEDIDGTMAVWWEGAYDEATGSYSDEYIYAYPLPNGPKVKVAGGDRSVYYPQIAGDWVTWVQEKPWEENPEEYWFSQIYGVKIGSAGIPQNDPVLLVPAATGYAQGDSTWVYSLSDTHLVWENATTVQTYKPGIYAMDLGSLQPKLLGSEIWRPSVANDKVVYTGNGLTLADLGGGRTTAIDASGDFATAAPTYAVYFRSVERDDTTRYDIVARGYTGGHEQTLGTTEEPPWFAPFLAASAEHVAFIVDGTVHLFEWR